MLSGDGGSGVDGIETVPPAPEVSDPDLSVLVDRVESAVAELAEQSSVAWSNADRRAVIQRMETATRSLTAHSYTWLNELISQHGLDVYPGSVPSSVAWMLRITPRAAGARVRLAAELGDRTAFSGEVLPPLLPHTAAALRAGLLDAKHVQMIREFFRHLPSSVDPQTRDLAEQQLVTEAKKFRPDDFAPVVAHLDSILNPDGDHDEDEDEDGKPRPRKRRDAFFYLGEQGADGMSEGKFCVDPELRAYLEALFSKAAKPGVNNPADPTSIIHDETGGKDSTSPAAASDGARPDPAAAEPDSPTPGGVCDTDTPPPPEPDDRSTSDQGLWSDAGLWNDGSFDGDDPCDGDGRCGDGLDCGCGTGPDGTIEPEGTAEPGDTTEPEDCAEPGDTTDPDDPTDPDDAVGSDDAPDTAARDAAAARVPAPNANANTTPSNSRSGTPSPPAPSAPTEDYPSPPSSP